jgi:hypothetical protein
MIRLKTFADNLRRPGLEVRDFDPADGGVKAQALFLFEKPGPMTVTGGRGKRTGSGFISRNNDDPTAEAVFNFMHEAAIPARTDHPMERDPWVERHSSCDGIRIAGRREQPERIDLFTSWVESGDAGWAEGSPRKIVLRN